MIQLKCENCGGKIERDESQVFVSESAVVVLAGHGFECQYCGAQFEPGTSHEKIASNTQVAIGSNIAQASGGGVAIVQRGSGAVAVASSVAAGRGGIAIGGDVGGDIVVGGKRVVIDR